MARTTVTANIHVNDDTEFHASKITDFVALKVGRDVDLFLMTSEQAAALADAAMDALSILKEMEGKTPTATDEMLAAGKAWINAIWGDHPNKDFNATLRWNLEDWDVVMNRHGSFVPTQKDVDRFHVKFDKGLK